MSGFFSMKHKRNRSLIAIILVIAVVMMTFASCYVRVSVVDVFSIADNDVRIWLEDIVEKDKSRPYRGNKAVMRINTTRNSIIVASRDNSIYDEIAGFASVNGVELKIIENELEDPVPAVFERVGRKLVFLKRASIRSKRFWAYMDRMTFDPVSAILNRYEMDKDFYYKFTDGKWNASTWKETFGEAMREETEKWQLEHKDTLAFSPVIAPKFVERYDSLTDENLRPFVADWKLWSKELRAFSNDSLINAVIGKIYSDYPEVRQGDSSALCALPSSIEVRYYSGPFRDYGYDSPMDRTEEWEYMMKASRRIAYVPSLDTAKDIVYITPEIRRLLSVYVGGVWESEEEDNGDRTRWKEINGDRVAELGNYIPLKEGHHGGYWHFCTMPLIFGIYFYDDGYVNDLRTTMCSGELVFVPYDTRKQKVQITDWVE